MKTTPLTNWQRRVFRTKRFVFGRELLRRWPKANLYLVGGFVRDLLLNRPSKDIDFVVTGVSRPELVKHLRRYGKVDFVGRTFGVFKFVPKGGDPQDAFDIALPRVDLPAGRTGAYRDVKVVSKANVPIEKDLERRDFTVNALAWNLGTAELIDISNGVEDLAKRRLRTAGDPATRFQEDYSRMLRGLRFAVTLDFEIVPATWTAMRKLIRHLNDERDGQSVVPREVIAKELLKTFWTNPERALDLYDRSGAVGVLMPEMLAMKKCPQPKVYHTEGSVWRHTELALAALRSREFRKRWKEQPSAELIMATLWHDIGKPPTLRTPGKHGTDRVRFDGHDVVGGDLARRMADRLKLAALPTDSPLHVDPDHLAWLLRNHLLLLNDIHEMRLTTIEKYFVRSPLGTTLRQLMLVDGLASIPPKGKPSLKHLVDLEKILRKLGLKGSKKQLPPPILRGDEIMKTLRLSGGPVIGRLLTRLREEQLRGKVRTKAQAKTFLKNIHANLER